MSDVKNIIGSSLCRLSSVQIEGVAFAFLSDGICVACFNVLLMS